MFVALFAAAAIQAAPAPPPVIWIDPPRIKTPPRALEAGASGVVVLRCEFNTQGRATNCLVVSETPPGLGFGREALRGARMGRAQVDQAGPREVTLNFQTR